MIAFDMKLINPESGKCWFEGDLWNSIKLINVDFYRSAELNNKWKLDTIEKCDFVTMLNKTDDSARFVICFKMVSGLSDRRFQIELREGMSDGFIDNIYISEITLEEYNGLI